MFNEKAAHPYVAAGLIVPRGFGWSFTYSPDSITEGLNAEIQGTIPIAGKGKPGMTFVFGVDNNGDSYQGFGTGSPGASVSGYHVFPNMIDLVERFLNPNPPLVPMPTKRQLKKP
jgi:hypothetical protein